jgi:branched-chain amino acid transport system permease protein
MFVEWIGVRPAIKIKSEFGWIMSTIALAIIFKNVAENIWGKDVLPFPSPLSSEPFMVFGANVQPMQVAVVARRAGDHAGGRDLQPQIDLRQGRGRHLQRPRRGRPHGHQHRHGDHLLVRAVVGHRGLRRRPGRAADADRRHHGRLARPEGLRGGDHRRPDLGHGRDRRRPDPRHRGNRDRLLHPTGYKEVPGLLLLLLVLAVKPSGLFGKAAIKKV